MTRWLVEALLRLAPVEFRRRHGEELLAVHDERAGARRNVLTRSVFALREVFGALALIIRLHIGLRDDTKGGGGEATMFETITQDVRFALRTLIRSPGFTSVAVIVLALGIGANTAIFSAVNAFFFRPLPFADADRLVTLYETNPEFGWDDASAAPANMFDWREQVEAFADVSAYFSNALEAFQDGEPLLITGTQVVGNFFTTLGVVPMMGRTFRMEETWDGEDDSIVISHALWVSYFGSDPDVIGKRIEFAIGDGEVLGVMPRGFRFPSEQRSGAHSA